MGGIDVGAFATPQITDVDQDGLKDLLIGEQSGNVNYYRNTGTSSSPSFTLTNANFGGVNVKQTGFIYGYSAPCLFQSGSSRKLIIGSDAGYLYMYDNIDGNLSGTFNLVDSMYLGIREGSRSAPFVGNINNDSYPDLFLGNYSGGVTFFGGVLALGISNQKSPEEKISIYPNPARESIFIDSPQKGKGIIYSIEGTVIDEFLIFKGENKINVDTYKNGIYIIKINSERNVLTGKIIILK
jgi:hypothetical protein